MTNSYNYYCADIATKKGHEDVSALTPTDIAFEVQIILLGATVDGNAFEFFFHYDLNHPNVYILSFLHLLFTGTDKD